MLAMIPNTRFRSSSISSTFRPALRWRGHPLHSAIESVFEFAIGPGRNVARLKRSAKFNERLRDNLSSLLWITGPVFVVNCELLIGLIAMPCISECLFPKLARQLEISLPLREPCEGAPCCPIRFGRQNG